MRVEALVREDHPLNVFVIERKHGHIRECSIDEIAGQLVQDVKVEEYLTALLNHTELVGTDSRFEVAHTGETNRNVPAQNPNKLINKLIFLGNDHVSRVFVAEDPWPEASVKNIHQFTLLRQATQELGLEVVEQVVRPDLLEDGARHQQLRFFSVS
jgi:hypothetical protein